MEEETNNFPVSVMTKKVVMKNIMMSNNFADHTIEGIDIGIGMVVINTIQIQEQAGSWAIMLLVSGSKIWTNNDVRKYKIEQEIDQHQQSFQQSWHTHNTDNWHIIIIYLTHA